MRKTIVTALFGAAALTAVASPALATTSGDGDRSTTTRRTTTVQDEPEFPWGLLGLLGLAGLAGLRKQPNDVVVDNRRDTIRDRDTVDRRP